MKTDPDEDSADGAPSKNLTSEVKAWCSSLGSKAKTTTDLIFNKDQRIYYAIQVEKIPHFLRSVIAFLVALGFRLRKRRERGGHLVSINREGIEETKERSHQTVPQISRMGTVCCCTKAREAFGFD